MAIIPEEERTRPTRGLTLADQVRDLKKELDLVKRRKETLEQTKKFKFPVKWRFKFNSAKRKRYSDLLLVIFLNKKNEMEPPRFMPIFEGNMVIWKNKPYEFDPRAMWTVKGVRGNPKAYLIKEIDRRPVRNHHGRLVYKDASVSNMDLDEVRERGDSTESDEFLIKAALRARTEQTRKTRNMAALVVIGIIVVGGLIWLFSS